MEEKTQNESLSEREIGRLKEKIFLTIKEKRIKKRNRRIFFAAAASFALLFGVGYFSQIRTEPSLEDFVKTAPKIKMDAAEGVTLLLGDDAQVNLNEEISSIQYSSSGQSVDIGSGKKITQKSRKKDKAVFNTVIVPYGKRTFLELSDGTKVWLNSGSKLIFPAVFIGKTRPVYLEGEAIFDVAHNVEKPFKVNTEFQEIEVLGTVFNVSSYPGDKVWETVLKTGSVSITYHKSESKKVKLSPGNLSSFNLKTAQVSTAEVDVDKYFSWKAGYLSLEKNSFYEIFTKLSRYYNFEFIIENEELANQTFSGKLDLNEDLYKIIEILKETTDFNFHKKGKTLIIQ